MATVNGHDDILSSSVDNENGIFTIETTCVFCHKELDKPDDPKLLDCFHTCCIFCWKSLPSTSPSASDSNEKSSCPRCNQEIIPRQRMFENMFVREHLTHLSHKLKNYTCSCDEGFDVTHFCDDCEEWLCDPCLTAHRRVRLTKNHIIKSMAEIKEQNKPQNRKYYCNVHSFQLDLFCDDCNEPICKDCTGAFHVDHNFEPLSNVCKDFKNELTQLLAEIKIQEAPVDYTCLFMMTASDEVSQRELDVSQRIRDLQGRYCENINEREEYLISLVAEECNRRKTELLVMSKELKSLAERIDRFRKFCESVLAHENERVLLIYKRTKMAQLTRMVQGLLTVPNPSYSLDLVFFDDDPNLHPSVSNWGDLHVGQVNDQAPMSKVVSMACDSVQQSQPLIQETSSLENCGAASQHDVVD